MAEFIALQDLQAPNTLVIGYRKGDGVTAAVVNEWGLVEGQQVEQDPNWEPERPADDDDDRRTWEAYVLSNGKTQAEVDESSLAELKAMIAPPPPPAWQVNDEKAAEAAKAEEASGGRPADSAAKADWIAYVVGQGADEAWANASSTTKDDLRNWQG